MLPEEVHIHFEVRDSCNTCCYALRSRCCGREDDPEFWINRDGSLEPFNRKSADRVARIVARERFIDVVNQKIEEMRVDRETAMARLSPVIPAATEDAPVTRSRLEAISRIFTELKTALVGE
jgi:hypothetical protein